MARTFFTACKCLLDSNIRVNNNYLNEEVLDMEKEHIIHKDGEVDTSKVGETLERIDTQQADEILGDFNEFRTYLSKRINLGKTAGLNEEQLAKTAEKIAGYLPQ